MNNQLDNDFYLYIFVIKQARLFIKFKCYKIDSRRVLTDCTKVIAKLAGFEFKDVATLRCDLWSKPFIFHNLTKILKESIGKNVIVQIIK